MLLGCNFVSAKMMPKFLARVNAARRLLPANNSHQRTKDRRRLGF